MSGATDFFLQQIVMLLSGGNPPGGAASESTLAQIGSEMATEDSLVALLDALKGEVALLTTASPEWISGHFEVPALEVWQLQSAFFQVNTDATAGNRRVGLRATDSLGHVIIQAPGPNQAASLSRTVNLYEGSPSDTFSTNEMRSHLPPLYLPSGARVSFLDFNGIAGTTISNQILTVRRFYQ